MVTATPRMAPDDRRSPRKMTPSGMANIGATDERMLPTATPAYLMPATYSTELKMVRTDSAAMRVRIGRPPLISAPTAPRAHGVAHSTAAATGNRTACAAAGLISESGAFIRSGETPHATQATPAVATPCQ